FLGAALAVPTASTLFAALRRGRWDDAADVLERATAGKQVQSAVPHVALRGESFTRPLRQAGPPAALFPPRSLSTPAQAAAALSLFDQGKFQLQDRVKKFLPAFTGDGRDDVTIRHLLTHVSGLPDQLANNNELRKEHAPLTEFAAQTIRTRLAFAPGV